MKKMYEELEKIYEEAYNEYLHSLDRLRGNFGRMLERRSRGKKEQSKQKSKNE